MTIRILAILLVGAMLAGQSAARADPLRVGTTGDYKPLTWHDPTTRTFSGTDIDLMEAFADDQGLKILFVKTTWPTLSADLAAGKFDAAIGGISRTPERARDFLLSVTIKTTGKVALVRCGDVPRFGSLADIDKAPITVVEGAPTRFSTDVWLALIAGGVGASAIALTLRGYVNATAGPVFMSITNYLVPLTAVLLGWAFGGEVLHAKDALAAALILAGVAVSRGALRALRRNRAI